MTEGYAEKGKSIANALEDLKANFYCELCDKQYHKHQEFDNHINSYDHAHKQRLKELKQREYARNVASKSWKDEKKQEKALKRLHQLAELRKQTDGSADDGPLFKAPRLKGPQEDTTTNKDERTASVRCAIVCSRDAFTSLAEESKQDVPNEQDMQKSSGCCFPGNQTQPPPSNGSSVNSRAGVSFCFSKKALLKLDSSASVFNESIEEANESSQFLHHKEKQMPVSFRHHVHVSETAAESNACSQPDETDAAPPDGTAENIEKFKDDKGSLENTKELSKIAQSNATLEMQSLDSTCTDQQSPKEVNVTSETELPCKAPTEVHSQAESSVQETCSNKHTVADAILIEHLSNLLSQKSVAAQQIGNSNEGNSTASNDALQNATESIEHSSSESLNTNNQAKPLSFLSVLSKDGNTILQWPTELVSYTKTQPSISYACNPLYFDFKCSQKNKSRTSKEKDANNVGCKNDSINRTSGTNAEKGTGSETDDQLPKRERLNLEGLAKKEPEPSKNYGATTETEHKAQYSHLQEHRPQSSSYFNSLHSCVVRESRFLRKQKILSHGLHDNTKIIPNYSSTAKSSEGDLKRKRFVHEEPQDFKDKWYNKSKTRKRKRHHEKLFSPDNSDSSRDSESDSSSSMSTKSSFSQQSSSSSSMSSSSTCRHEDTASTRSTCEASSENRCYTDREHKSDASLESDCPSEAATKPICRCRNDKHKTSDISRSGALEHYVCSRCHGLKTQRDVETDQTVDRSHSVQINSSENFPSKTSSSDKSIASSPLLKSPQSTEDVKDYTEKECLYKDHFQNIPLAMNCKSSPSENDVQHELLKQTLVSHLPENGLSTKQSKDNNTEHGVQLSNNPQNYFDISLPLADPIEITLPLHDATKPVTGNGAESLIANLVNNIESKGLGHRHLTTQYKDSLGDIQQINTECRTEVPFGEAPGQFVSQVQTFMQNPDPVHLNFPYGWPSLRHPGEIDSPDAKEHQKRPGHPDINMRPGPVDGNFKCCYESTMQDLRKMDNNRWLHHKPSPPLAQQPVTFAPDEVDKYKLLQLQAQQHMQKQLLTKHFKALPTNGSPVFSSAPPVQPVAVQHQPSITTIHHAFMQRYAVTSPVHPHVGHFPLPHLNSLPPSQFPSISLPSLPPALFTAHPQLIAAGHPLAHPLHLVSAASIHPAHLTIQAIPHGTLIPTLLAPHPSTGMHPTLQLHPLIHPLFQGQDFHHLTGPNHPH
ncbi:zinc finger protein 804B isoform X2 [Hyperolius riggenbachi]|uniref:zinc finger protein 804B isoform X2 n=1 Tax=Hyperolius riggenbachi TaxID=752182 RepID=UPI0035A367E7